MAAQANKLPLRRPAHHVQMMLLVYVPFVYNFHDEEQSESQIKASNGI